MPRKPKNKISKKSVQSPSDAGSVWSGRGIAIPVAGAVDGSGDGSKYLGRPRRPWWYTGNRGSPSQSADSGFSSRLGSVNKGYEISDEYMSMFPDQEEETPGETPEEERLAINRKTPTYMGGGGAYPSPMFERDIQMKNTSTLREFVREAIREEVEKRNVEKPESYMLFKSEYLGTDDLDDEDEIGYVNYKADDGMVSYEPRDALQETMLRKIIRSHARSLIEASRRQKKRD